MCALILYLVRGIYESDFRISLRWLNLAFYLGKHGTRIILLQRYQILGVSVTPEPIPLEYKFTSHVNVSWPIKIRFANMHLSQF